MIARSAQIRVVVGDPVAVAKKLGALAEAQGGYVSESKQWLEGTQVRMAVTLRVPTKELFHTLEAIRAAAIRTENESITAQDITEEYTDLGAQLTNLEATEKELRELLTTVRKRTQKAADVLEVFNQLAKVRSDIDRTKARLNVLGQLVELSTISLELVPDALAQPLTSGRWRPLAAVKTAFVALLATLEWLANALIWLVVYVVPIVVLLIIPVLVLRAGWKAMRRRRQNRTS